MSTFKIYGESHELTAQPSAPVECYAIKDEIVYEVPKGKLVGYTTLDDGTVVACYKKSKIWVPILVLLLVLLFLGAGAIWLFVLQPKDVEFMGTKVKQGEDNNVVSYEGFMTLQGDQLTVDFTNGDYPARITVQGDGIETETVTVEPNQHITTIGVKKTTNDALQQANIIIETETSRQEFPIMVEAPEFLNENDTLEGMSGFFHGEEIYGSE